jgi:hypothetical protein
MLDDYKALNDNLKRGKSHINVNSRAEIVPIMNENENSEVLKSFRAKEER